MLEIKKKMTSEGRKEGEEMKLEVVVCRERREREMVLALAVWLQALVLVSAALTSL